MRGIAVGLGFWCSAIALATAAQSIAGHEGLAEVRPSSGIAIAGGTLIDGRGGAPLRDSVIVMLGDRIVAVGPRARIAIPRGVTVIDARGRWVVPGMIDNHVHVSGATDLAEWTRVGVTTLVDNGSRIPPDALKRRFSSQPGAPRLFTSGPILTARGGYPALGAKNSSARFVADPRADVADVAGRLHADFVKIAIERGFLSDYDDEGWPALDPAAVRAIVDEAHRRGLLVRAHVTQTKELSIAIDAGVDVIAHTPFVELPEALLRRAVRRGTIFVSTVALWNDPRLVAIAARNLARFVALGGRIAIGSDYPNFPRRALGEELRILAKAGIPAERLIRALTSDGAAAIGRERELGTIAPGMLADLVVLAGDPRKSVEALSDVVVVVRGGERVR